MHNIKPYKLFQPILQQGGLFLFWWRHQCRSQKHPHLSKRETCGFVEKCKADALRARVISARAQYKLADLSKTEEILRR